MPTYKLFTSEDVISVAKTKTYPLWSDSPLDPDTLGEAVLTSFFTSSAVTSSWDSNYFWDVYAERVDPTTNPSVVSYNQNADPQFSIAVGTTASIQLYTVDDVNRYSYPSNAVYRQFANILTQQGSTAVLTTNNGNPIPIAYFVAVSRDRLKDSIDPSTWKFTLSGSGANRISLAAASTTAINQSTPIDIILSGSSYIPGNTFGIFYPTKGVLALDANKLYSGNVLLLNPSGALSQSIADQSDVTSFGYKPSLGLNNFFQSIKNGAFFQARSLETVQATHYFVRVKNNEFNSSENPTWKSGSNNEINPTFITNPTTFITTVGLYDGNDPQTPGKLVAVAKLSKPLIKSTDSEALIRIRLDF